jgi:hypothetical protein
MPFGSRFVPRPLPDPDLAAYVARGIAGAWKIRARVVVHAPAETIAERGRWTGTVEPIDDMTCVLDAGANSIEQMAVFLGMLDADFTVTEPPELVEHVGRLARRYAAAATT